MASERNSCAFERACRLDSRDPIRLRDPLVEDREALTRRAIEQILAVDVHDVEEEGRESCLGSTRAVRPAPEAAHGGLEAVRRPVVAERDRLSVEDRRVDRKAEHDLDHLWHAVRHVGEAPRERSHVATASMHLQAGAVELPLDRRRTEAFECALEVVRRLREHRLDRAQDLEREPGQRPAHRHRGQLRQRRGGRPPAWRRGARLRARARRRARPRRASPPRALPGEARPSSSDVRKRCSGSVARSKSPASSARRTACEPLPEAAAMRETARVDVEELQRRRRLRRHR